MNRMPFGVPSSTGQRWLIGKPLGRSRKYNEPLLVDTDPMPQKSMLEEGEESP